MSADGAGCVFVTSHLVVGATPTAVAGPFTVTDNVLIAVRAIQAGNTAVLPAGRFDLAEKVMRGLGASSEHTAFSLAYAQGLLPVQADSL